ncbi:hypothetical protein C8J57DRAFT_1611743 [Mycena rebaudengoi]|nr:hypothetical protein C8J57DRAFT_1611743 [Mycena rebaudengoi]
MRLSTHSGTSNGRAAADEVRGGGGAGAVHAVPECGGLDQGHGRRWADELAPRIVMPSSATWHSQRRWCGATQAQVVCMWVSILEDEGSLGKQCAAFQALMGGLSSSGLCGTAGKFKATDKAEWEKGSAGDPRTTFALKAWAFLCLLKTFLSYLSEAQNSGEKKRLRAGTSTICGRGIEAGNNGEGGGEGVVVVGRHLLLLDDDIVIVRELDDLLGTSLV